MKRELFKSDPRTLHETRRSMYRITDEYRRSFVDPETGRIAAEYVETRSCPVCESSDARPMFEKNGGTYVKCASCAMVHLNPVFKDDALRRYYEGNSAVQAHAHTSESEFYTSIYEKGLAGVERFVRPGAILDIGCSSGFFLDVAKRRGWGTHGIELNRAEFAMAKQKGHQVWDVPIGEMAPDRGYKAITLWDVFEHIKDGRQYLHSLAQYLDDDAVIFMQIPNAAALAARMLQQKCNMFDGIEHVNLYSPATLEALCERAGFSIWHLESVIGELGPIKNYLNYEDPYFGEFKDTGDLDFLSDDLILRSKLGYKLQVVLRPIQFLL